MTRIAFFDIDNTLVAIGHQRMTDAVTRALDDLRAAGVRVFVASGRHKCVMANLHGYPFDGYVCMNGALITVGDEVIHRHPVCREDAVAVGRAVMEMNIPCIVYSEEGMAVNTLDDYSREMLDRLYITPPERKTDLGQYCLENEIYEFTPFLKPEMLSLLKPCLTRTAFSMGNGQYADLIPDDVCKADGILRVLDHYGFTREESMAFGDGYNDVQMLELAGIGVAMGNAPDEVKAHADYVTLTIEEDGVAAAIRHFLP